MGNTGKGADSEDKEVEKPEVSSAKCVMLSGNTVRAIGYESGVQGRGKS